MATLILSEVGAVAGANLLPQGLNLFGRTVSGAALGGALGAAAGRLVDASLATPLEGHRIDSLRIMESREGAPLPRVYGRMRVAGQVIWASRLREERRSQRAGKGGPEITTYSYSISVAIAVAQGPITRIDRIWANGEPLETRGLNFRVYTGSETQAPDPLITAIEGADHTPAYRGTAYVVFEDLPLGAFGNRLPQLSFEVIRAGEARLGSVRRLVRGVNIIPATGEFVYATETVSTLRFPATERPINMNSSGGEPDFLRSLDQLQADLPDVKHVALTVAWFGNSLDAETCRILPGIETRDRDTLPWTWSVGPFFRDSAHLISSTNGRVNYGGTPDDRSVEQAVAALKAAGYRVTLSPFLLMDMPGFPWRGRIGSTQNGSDAIHAALAAFLGQDGAGGFRHFVLHHARLAAQSGADAILLGSELVQLTRLQDAAGGFPFVDALIQLAAEVRSIVGPDVEISYAADWTEYGAYQKPGTSDVLFPLDPLWMSSDVDFVGVDWYPPITDWRDGSEHLDALAGFTGPADPDYLRAGMAGGEGYDWYYASDADRIAQNRTPIHDTAHGEDWVFRQKDLRNWYQNRHFERPNGIRNNAPTSWRPAAKPVRLMEIGFPAIDRGTNAPNRFYDPKSVESLLPHFSSGERDDLQQKYALEAALSYWQEQSFVDAAYVWCWDARPWPDFPQRTDVWSDGDNWRYGHWLNGRSGLITLKDVITDLAGLISVEIDGDGLYGLIDGYAVTHTMALRTALAPLASAFDLILSETSDGLCFTHRPRADRLAIQAMDLVEGTQSTQHTLLDKAPTACRLEFISAEGSYEPKLVEARTKAAASDTALRVQFPMVLSARDAATLAESLLKRSQSPVQQQISLGPSGLSIEIGDAVALPDAPLQQVTELSQTGFTRRLTLHPAFDPLPNRIRLIAPEASPTARLQAAPYLRVIDGPRLPQFAAGPLIACFADPWRGAISVFAGRDVTRASERAVCESPAQIGRLMKPVAAGPAGRWDRATVLEVEWFGAPLETLGEAGVLSGESLFLLETDQGWEAIAVADVEQRDARVWRLRTLLRGGFGTEPSAAPAGAVLIAVTADLASANLTPSDIGAALSWRAGTATPIVATFEDRGGLPWRPVHLRAEKVQSGIALRWTARSADFPASWSLPEAANAGAFAVELAGKGGNRRRQIVSRPELTFSDESVETVSVAQLGEDGRLGPWTSIPIPAH